MSEPETKEAAAYRTSLQTRNFEIDLFWKRALFFWGFIAAAFVAYATLKKDDSELVIPVVCFGMVCSLAWTLANRGSKYWQENWEAKVEQFEPEVTGPLFVDREPRQRKGLWGAQHYSVSKLAIALSDFTFAFWVGATAVESYALVSQRPLMGSKTTILLVVPALSVVYLLIMLWWGRTNPPNQRAENPARILH